jgi:hypothetical protein
MATKRQVITALIKIGATLTEDANSWHMVHIDAPVGMVWHTDTHAITVQFHPGHESKSDLWADLLEDIEAGVFPCNGYNDQLPECGPCDRCAEQVTA